MVKEFSKDPSIPDMREGDTIPVTYIEPVAGERLIRTGKSHASAKVPEAAEHTRMSLQDVFDALGID